MVPVVPVDNEAGPNEYDAQALIGDIAYQDRAVFNNWSRLDVIVCDQTFSQLIFPVEASPTELIEDPRMRDKFIVMATNRVLLYSAQAGVKPEFISPDAAQATFILDMITRQVKQLYGVQGLAGETATEVTSQSGAAKGYDFDKLNKLLAGKADNLQEAEEKLIEVFAAWTASNVEGEVNYPDEFDVKSLSDEISTAQQLAMLDISATFKKEIDKMVVNKALPDADPDVMSTIMDEIEARADEDPEADENGGNAGDMPFDKAKGKAKPGKKAGGKDEKGGKGQKVTVQVET